MGENPRIKVIEPKRMFFLFAIFFLFGSFPLKKVNSIFDNSFVFRMNNCLFL